MEPYRRSIRNLKIAAFLLSINVILMASLVIWEAFTH